MGFEELEARREQLMYLACAWSIAFSVVESERKTWKVREKCFVFGEVWGWWIRWSSGGVAGIENVGLMGGRACFLFS